MADCYNPPGIWGPNGRAFSQGVIVPEGSRTVYVTGQVAWDEHNQVIGLGDVRAQMRKCVENTRVILEAAGGTLDDIASLTVLFVNREDLPAIQDVRREFFEPSMAPASIMFQVSGLVIPEFLIELVPVAVIPQSRFRPPS